jgi:acyl carrier protein
VLGHAGPEDVDPEEPFKDLGFSSLTAGEFAGRLSRAAGRKLPPTLVFDHPTAVAVADHLAGLLAPADAAEGGDPEETRIRAALAALPLPVLREAGLLDTLLALAAGGTAPAVAAHEPFSGEAGFDGPDSIDDLDGDALIELALRDTAV